MWQEYNHREVFDQIEREFALAQSIGCNAVRAIIQFGVQKVDRGYHCGVATGPRNSKHTDPGYMLLDEPC